MRDLNSIFCVLRLLPSRNTMSSRGVFDAARDGSYFHPVPFFEKKKSFKKTKKKWEAEHWKICITADVHERWKKVL